jgi:hypothetical protein
MRRLLDTSQRSRLQFRPHHLCESMTAEQHLTQKAPASGCEADWGLCTLCEADLGASSHVAYSGRTLSGSQSVYTRRFGPAWSMASIACRMAGDASSNFNAIFIVQELSFGISPSILELTSNRLFGVISNARHKSEIRVDATAFVPRSYFWICPARFGSVQL